MTWIRWMSLALGLGALACGAVACGSSVETAGTDAAGGAGVGTSASTSATTGGGGQGGDGAAGGAGGAGGACPDVICSMPCPGPTWPELDGCPSCACAADLSLVVDGVARPTQHVGLSVVASEYIGGINRWIFDFTWHHDDPLASDDEEVVEATVRLMQLGPELEPTEANVTHFSPENDGNPLELLPGSYTLYGFAIITAELEPGGGFFSIRRVGDTFEGYVSLDFTSSTTPTAVHASGPFAVPVP